ncbi:MAG: hypothetical protein ACI84D_002570, partial [Thalassolituus oleivorans]
MTRLVIRHLFCLIIIFALGQRAQAQTFVDASQLILSPPAAGVSFSAITVADFNGDGRTDIYHPGRLYRQQVDGTYLDILLNSGITIEGQFPLVALPGDRNADGLLDLAILDQLPGSRYYDNVNAEQYRLANGERSLSIQTLSTGGVWADFDVDGRLDLFVGASDGQNQLYLSNILGTFTNASDFKLTSSAPGGCGLAIADWDGDLDLDVYVAACLGTNVNSLMEYDSVRDRFTDRAGAEGVQSFRYSYSAVWLDYDNDGWQDLFVVNARFDVENGRNQLYRNLGGTSFQEVAEGAGVAGGPSTPRRGSAAADFNNDGWTDLYVTLDSGRHQLYMNQGDGTFLERGLGVLPGTPGTSIATAADVNDDGWIDLIYGLPAGHTLLLNGGENNWTKIALRHPGQNRRGIGARIQIKAGGLTQTKQMVPGGGGVSQSMESELHFGLGAAAILDEVTVSWQDGSVDVLTNLPANQRLTIARGGSLNSPPESFALTSPPDAAFFDTSATAIGFAWAPAADNEPVTYTLSVQGPGTRLRFPDLTRAQIALPTELLAPDQVYTWSVVASDGLSASPGQGTRVFTFGDPQRAASTLVAPAIFDFGFPEMSDGQARFMDIDGDLDLDLLVLGLTDQGPRGALYKAVDQGVITTTGGAEFIFKGLVDTGTAIDAVLEPTLATGDYDGDGDTDAVVSGLDRDSGLPSITLYRNVDGSLLAEAINIAARWGGPITISDIDGDGDGDLLVSGSTVTQTPFLPSTIVYRNNGTGLDEWAILPGAMFGSADWADVDGDGDLDLALLGDADTGLPQGSLYENDFGTFVQHQLPGLELVFSSAAWGDYDADGLADLLVSGGRVSPDLLEAQTALFHQDTPWTFSRLVTPLNDVLGGVATWGDYENDGDLDIIISGGTDLFGEKTGRVFRNQNGLFVAELDFQGTLGGDMTTGDYNQDGDLDFMVLGLGADGNPTILFFINQQVAEPVP